MNYNINDNIVRGVLGYTEIETNFESTWSEMVQKSSTAKILQ